ncbi:MAG: creatininase family protein [Armatimonadetes bacterium]|jgi:creatinine amidohydrolase|nr:creatininase family protein [Armatimonadota bacterium]
MQWMELTSDQLADARERADGVALIPVGSVERHGPHLPLGCDTLCAERIAARVAAIEPVVVLPVMAYTYVAQPMFQPGAIHIHSSLLLAFLTQVLDEVHRNGFGKIVLLHNHGGNIPMSQTILQHVLEEAKPYALYSIPPWAGVSLETVRETAEVGHACELETSLALALFPELVRMDLLGPQTYPAEAGLDVGAAQTPVDWIARYPNCATGRPQAASAEKGERLARLWVESVVETLRKVKRDTVVPAWMRRSREH